MIVKKYTKKYEKLAMKFSCGNVVIDNFLKYGSALDENQGITYILLSEEEDFIIGFYNIEVGRVDKIEAIDSAVYYEPMGGTVNIRYLAVHVGYQRKKIWEWNGQKMYVGDYLLRDCEKRIMSIRQQVGISFITLYSTEQGYHLYRERNEYIDFENDMSTFVKESDSLCYKLYKWLDDIA